MPELELRRVELTSRHGFELVWDVKKERPSELGKGIPERL
jgi:hypothetical protein